MTSESSNLKKNSEPQPPFLWPCNLFQSVCLPMPRQEDGGSCFMNGDIWVAVNTAILKIDVRVGSFGVAGKGREWRCHFIWLTVAVK